MKRHPSLRQLSDDHHTALVLARRLRRTPSDLDADALASLAGEVQKLFEAELEPHFQVEEQWLLPALRRRGAVQGAARLASDHAHLRALVRSAWTPDTPGALGTLLDAHVRFEERTLFPEAEALLSEPELAAVERAARPEPSAGR